MKSLKKVMALLACIMLVVGMMPLSAFAADYEAGHTYYARKAGTATGSSSNGFTKAMRAWEGTDGLYYLAVASRDKVNEMDASFRAKMDAAIAEGKYLSADYILNDSALTVKVGDSTYFSSTASAATGKGSDIWCVICMTEDAFRSYKTNDGTYKFPVLDAGGFALRGVTVEEEFEKKDYTVKYYVDGVLVGEVEYYKEGEKVVIRPKYVKPGYTVSDWSISEDFEMPDHNVEIYATTEANKHTVTYYVDGEQVGEAEVYAYGDKVVIRPKYVKPGYTVSDWSITGDFSMPDEDVKIYATTEINKHTVTYYVDGEQVGEAEVYAYGDTVVIRPKYVKPGYTVSDWSITEDFDMPDEDVKIYATTEVNKHTVTYYVDGEQVGEAEVYAYGDTVVIRPKYVKPGYTVSDWSITADFDMPDEDVKIYATSTINEHTVTYYVDGEQVGEVEVYKYGEKVVIRPKYVKPGYTVSDWSIAADFEMPDEDVKIYATTTINKHTVTYYVDGVQVGDVEIYAYGDTVVIRPKFVKTGYTVSDWSITENFDMPDEDIEIFATTVANKHTVTYFVDGEQVGEVETYSYGDEVVIRDKFVKEGYTVSDWSVTENFDMPDEDVEIYATTEINQHTVTYYVDGVQVGEVETYNFGDEVVIREKFTKVGYTVSDWDVTENFLMPDEDVEIHATSRVNVHTVTYYVDGEVVGEIEVYAYGETVVIREKFVKEGYTVSDWSITEDFEMPDEDVEIFATTRKNSVPNTGDESNVALWSAMAMLSLAGLYFVRKRRIDY